MTKEEWEKIKASNRIKHRGTFIPIPRRYPSALHKKLAKLERVHEAAEGKPLAQARAVKCAAATYGRMKKAEVKPIK